MVDFYSFSVVFYGEPVLLLKPPHGEKQIIMDKIGCSSLWIHKLLTYRTEYFVEKTLKRPSGSASYLVLKRSHICRVNHF